MLFALAAAFEHALPPTEGAGNMGSDGAAQAQMDHQILEAHKQHSLRLLNARTRLSKREDPKDEPATHVNHAPGPTDTEWHAEMAKHGQWGEKHTDEDLIHDKQPTSSAFMPVFALVMAAQL